MTIKDSPPLLALQRRRPGTFALLIAATCVLMLLAVALALSLREAARSVADAAAQRIIVQVVDADPAKRADVADAAMARLDRVPGLVSAHRLPDREARSLIAPYIADVSADELPLPILIDVRAGDRAAVADSLKTLPTVQVTGAGAELGALARLIDAMRGLASGVALAAAIATGLIAMLSARAALAREGTTLEILHALGATDRQLTRLVSGKIARDAGIGAALGMAAAICVILTIAARIADMGVGVGYRFGAGSWAILAALALGLVALAVVAAQAALLLALRRTP